MTSTLADLSSLADKCLDVQVKYELILENVQLWKVHFEAANLVIDSQVLEGVDKIVQPLVLVILE